MSITINELTIHVPGNVVKTNDGGVSRLRVTQEQAQLIYDQLGPVLDFLKSQDAPPPDGARPHVGPLVISNADDAAKKVSEPDSVNDKTGGVSLPAGDVKSA